MIERGIDGTSVYLIKVSYLECSKDLGLWNSDDDDDDFMSSSFSIAC